MKSYRLMSTLMLAVLFAAACAPAPVAPTAAPPEVVQPTAAVAAPTTEAPTSAPQPAQPTSTELNLYAWTDYVPQKLLDDYAAKYGIKVNYDTYSSNEEMLAKLQAGASGYDLVIPSDYTVDIMVKQDMLEPLDMTQIPNFVNVDTRFTNQYYDPGNKYSVPYQWGTTALAYEKTRVPFEPKSWADLWDLKYKNRLVMLDDFARGSGHGPAGTRVRQELNRPCAVGSGESQADRLEAKHPALQQ